jgi:hypothetical protein
MIEGTTVDPSQDANMSSVVRQKRKAYRTPWKMQSNMGFGKVPQN